MGRCHIKRLSELLNCTKSKICSSSCRSILLLKIFMRTETFGSKIEQLSYQIFKVNGAIIIQKESSLDTTQTFGLDSVSSKSTGTTLICLSFHLRGSKSVKKPQWFIFVYNKSIWSFRLNFFCADWSHVHLWPIDKPFVAPFIESLLHLFSSHSHFRYIAVNLPVP